MVPFPELLALGWSDDWSASLPPGTRPGRVVRHDGVRVLIATPEVRSLPVRPGVETPVVGDWVAVDGDDLVAALLPRRSLLRRRDAIADAEQAMAANVDLLVIVCGLDRPMRDGRVQRAVALAWDAGATPLVVLTKADLVPDPVHVGETVDAVRSAVHEVDVLVVSASDGTGMADLLAVVSGQTVVLLGESGAGKSTLVNALVGEDVAATGAVRAGDAKGRHTTTTRQLHPLPGGGVLLDSPGIRAIGLWVDPEAVDAVFPELEVLASDCRFADCAHDGEPGCAVSAAVADGRLDDERLATWRAMRGEATAAARTDQERRRHERKFGKVAKQAQARKGRRQP